MRRVSLALLTLLLVPVTAMAAGSTIPWSATPVRVLTGFQVPESVVIDPATSLGYVSNIVGSGYWSDDNAGHVTRLTAAGQVGARVWRKAAGASPLQGPKGLGLLKGWLYAADNNRLRKLSLTSGAGFTIAVKGAQRLNDVAIADGAILVTDSATGRIHRVSPDGHFQRVIATIPGVNGVTTFGKRMFAVGWDSHDLYEVYPDTSRAPRAFGLARHFKNLDGIEVLSDGTFIVSDFYGNKVCAVSRDGRTVTTLIKLDSPADIGLDRKRGLLYVPQFLKDRVAVYKLSRR